MMIRATLISLMTLGALVGSSTANAQSAQPAKVSACAAHQELVELERAINEIIAQPKDLSEDAQSQLVGVFDGGWLIATALGDHSRAHCFATLSDALGFLPAQSMTGDDVKLEKVEMPAGLATQVHRAAMKVIRRL